MSEEENKPEGLDEFIANVFGNTEKAEEFAKSLEDPMVEAWKGIHEVYTGLRSGGFTTAQANGVLGAYLYYLIASIEGL